MQHQAAATYHSESTCCTSGAGPVITHRVWLYTITTCNREEGCDFQLQSYPRYTSFSICYKPLCEHLYKSRHAVFIPTSHLKDAIFNNWTALNGSCLDFHSKTMSGKKGLKEGCCFILSASCALINCSAAPPTEPCSILDD